MASKAKKALWAGIGISVAGLAAVGYAEWRLRGDQLTPLVNGLLAENGIGGSIGRVEARLGGAFTATGLDLTLPDGTTAKVESVNGDLAVLALLRGKVRVESVEAKGIDVVVGAKKETKDAKDSEEAKDSKEGGGLGNTGNEAGLGLGRFSVGKLAAAGRARLADGTELRFNARSDGIDFTDKAELRAGLAWGGRAVLGKTETDPRADVILAADFARTLGDQGIGLDALAADLRRLSLRVSLRDAGPLALGGPSLDLRAEQGKAGLAGTLQVKDAKGATALDGAVTLGAANELRAKVDLATAEFGLLTPSDKSGIVRAKGDLRAAWSAAGIWSGEAKVTADWPDLSAFSPRLPAGERATWTAEFAAKGDAVATELTSMAIAGSGGVSIRATKPLVWKGGPLPADSSGGVITIAASDAPLGALAPLMAPTGIVPVGGIWGGSLEVAFSCGEAVVTSLRALAARDVALERDGKPWISGIDVALPLRADRKGLALDGFEAGMGGRRLVGGSAAVRPLVGGGWEADAKLEVDLGDLAGQPGWESLPLDRLRGMKVLATGKVRADAGKAPVVTDGAATIARGTTTLLRIAQRLPIVTGEPLPQGPLASAKAENLPLETLAALVPGLGIGGTLERADLTIGARSDGSWYVRSEVGPVTFSRTSVSWDGTPYLRDCDLGTEIDLAFGARSELRFAKTDLRSKGRTLASGSATIPLGGGWPTGEITGELGALATQPFAAGLGQVAGGSYRATLAPAADGGVTAEVTVRDAGFRDRAIRINRARLGATLSTEGDARRIKGGFLLGAGGETAGDFDVTFRDAAGSTRWQAKVEAREIVLEDLLGLAPPEEDPATAPGPAASKPDERPAWHGNVGTAEIRVGKARLGDLRASDLVLNAVLEPEAARVTSLTGTVIGGSLAAEARLTFNRAQARGPYVLNAMGKLAAVDLPSLGKALPGMEGNLEGKVDGRVLALSWGPTLGDLAGNLTAELALDSKGGRARLPAALSATADKAGEVADTVAGIAALGAMFGKGRDAERAAQAAVSISALRELQKAASDFRFDLLEVRAQRLADGTIKLGKAEARGPDLGIRLAGQLSMLPGLEAADWPFRFAAEVRGGGKLGEHLVTLGFDPGAPTADGLRQGPAFDVEGTANEWRTNLIEALRNGPRRAQESAPRSPTQGAPTGPGGFLPFGR